MNLGKKIICVLSVVVFCLTTLSFAGCNEIEPSEPVYVPVFSTATVIGSFTGTDDDAKNNTPGRFQVAGTDLGISVNIYGEEPKTLLLFGDTFATDLPNESDSNKNWRSGVIGLSTDYDLSDNLSIDSFWGEEGFKDNACAKSPLYSIHNTNKGETTKIYTGGIEIDGSIYLFYVSRRSVSKENRPDSNNYSGVIKSTDGGITWQRVWNLTWVDHVEGTCHPVYGTNKDGVGAGTSAEKLKLLINEDIDGTITDNIKIEEHQGYHFTQIYPVDGNDGYIYIFGRGGYRTTGLQLGRVRRENFEDFNAYEYLEGYDGQGNSVWSDNIDYACYIVEDALSNMSIVYNKFAKRWVMSYLDCSNGSGVPLVIRYSESIDKGFTQKVALLPNSGDTSSLYGGYLNDLWVENDGETYYFVFSRWSNNLGIYRSYVAKATVSFKEVK